MIARLWRGWSAPESADSYERMLREDVLPGIQGIEGYHGAYILRSNEKNKTAFIIVTLFDSLDSERPFANDTTPMIEPEARQLLSLFESTASHYDVRMSPAMS